MDSNVKLALFTALSATALLTLVSGAFLVWPDPSLENVFLFLAFLAPTVLLAVLALTRDPLTFWKYVIGLIFAAAAFHGLVALVDDATSWTHALPAVWAALGLLGVVWLRSRLGRIAGLPNVIGQRLPRGILLEQEGIHFAAQGISGHEPSIDVYLQNSWDADRNVVVQIEERGSTVLGIPPLKPICLGPASVGVLSIPLDVTTPGVHLLNVELRVSGIRGRRVRPYRGVLVRPRVTPGVFLLNLLMGQIVWGGGTRISLTSIRAMETAVDPRWETLWEWKGGRDRHDAATTGSRSL